MIINLDGGGIVYYGIVIACGISAICRVIYASKKMKGVTVKLQAGNRT